MQYIRHGWYAAGFESELADGKFIARRFLNTPVLLFRAADGTPSAILDRCPHRFAPLSRGKRTAQGFACGYHGLEFDGQGRCVHNPFGASPPPRASVPTFALAVRYGILWIWLGRDAADPALLPVYPAMEDRATWRVLHSHLVTPSHYLLAVDNLMDLSHPEFLHDASLGSPALRSAHYEVTSESARTVHSNRWFDEGPLPPAMERAFPSGGRPVSHWINMRWDAPSNLWLEVGACLAGTARESGWQSWAAHLITPETDTTAHYFFALCRRETEAAAQNNDAELMAMIMAVFQNDDCPMLGAVEARMGGRSLWDLKPAMLPGDAGAVRVREAIDRLLSGEVGE